MNELEIWKSIPGHSRYEVSNLGSVRNIATGKVIQMHEKRTTKGSYLNCTIVDDFGFRKTTAVHRFVCLAFHGLPVLELGDKPEVNHKDGNKHNNRESNLEWVNRSMNIIHAVREGLRSDTVRVTVIDHIEETSKTYPAVSVVADWFGVNSPSMNKIIARHRDVKWRNRYTFVRDDSSYRKTNRKDRKCIRFKDYRSGEVYLADSSTSAMDVSGVVSETILYRLARNDITLLNGFVFMNASDVSDFPNYTETEVEESIRLYQNRPVSKAKRFGVTGKNYITDEVVEFSGNRDVELKLGFKKNTVGYLLKRKDVKLFRGWYFQYSSELTEWPVFDREYAEVTLRKKDTGKPSVYVVDLETGNRKLYATLKEFCDEVGVWLSNVCSHLKKRGTCPYKNRWIFEFKEL